MKSKLPNFIISGFPKCGSSALHYYLENHPEIFMPKQKELHFFTNSILSKLNQGPGDKATKISQIKLFEDYEKSFKNVGDELAIGDASPSYINYPEKFKEIKDRLFDPKVIILLRDPVKRAYSNYLHLVREGRETLGFYEALLEEENRKKKKFSDFWYYRFNSTYTEKVQKAQEVFSDVLIITQEELNSKPNETIKSIFTFLNVNADYTPTNLSERYNEGGVFEDNFITRTFFKQSKLKSFIKKRFPIPVEVKNIKNKVVNNYRKPTPLIDEKAEDFLVKELSEDVSNIKKIGVDVSGWNKKFYQKN
ncbi:sulfotransferase [uncultured Formosa sp.]|uniref:sulfotransferase family protein n=1 Tax=uncultured Formosa sp. TaxID=255435 RepID=UPI0026255F39|nr:sulfotransferase [uncultured Formosa sp.]